MTITWKIEKIKKHPKSGLVRRVRLLCEAQEGDEIKKISRGVRIQQDDTTKDMDDVAILELAKTILGEEKVTKIESRVSERLSK